MMDESELPLDRMDENTPTLPAPSIDGGEDGGTDSGQATVPGDAPAPATTARRRRRRWLWLMGAVVLFLVLVVVVGLFAWGTITRSEARAGAISFLRYNGLDRLLTDQDDPCLWAAAIRRHGLPDCFGIGIEDGANEQIGMVDLERLCFGGADEELLRTGSPDPKQSCFLNRSCLYVSRPSASLRHALVYKAEFSGGTARGSMYGQTMLWIRQPDGSWHETEKCVGSWNLQWD